MVVARNRFINGKCIGTTLVEQFRVEESMAQLKHRDAAVDCTWSTAVADLLTSMQGRKNSLVNNYAEDYVSYVVAFYQLNNLFMIICFVEY